MTLSLAVVIPVFLASALVAVYASEKGHRILFVVAKPLTTVLLLFIAGRPESRLCQLIELGILLSVVGDVALLSAAKKAFLLGLGFFLGAHVSYTVAFFGAAGAPSGSVRVLVCAGAMGIISTLLLRKLWAGAAGLRGPLVAYTAAISAMVVSAVAAAGGAPSSLGASSPAWAFGVVGAVLFYCSDSSLALDRFHRPIKHAPILTLGIYWLGQLGIALTARPGRGIARRMVAKRREPDITTGPAPSLDGRGATQEPQDHILSRVLWTFAILGVGLRLALFWVNPPRNSFDDHFGPIFWIMKYGSLPRKDALWQSYQPPVFYVVSAVIGSVERVLGAPPIALLKSLQFVSCAAGILTLGITYRILEKLPLSRFARVIAFGAACFLPVHIYQCAMHSNDTISNLGVAVCCWLMLVARERSFPHRLSVLLGLALAITLFTKYTAFVVLPMMFALLIPIRPSGSDVPARRLAAAWGLTIAVPVLVLGGVLLRQLEDLWPGAAVEHRAVGSEPFPAETSRRPQLHQLQAVGGHRHADPRAVESRFVLDLDPRTDVVRHGAKVSLLSRSRRGLVGPLLRVVEGRAGVPGRNSLDPLHTLHGIRADHARADPAHHADRGARALALPRGRTRSGGDGLYPRGLQILPVLLAANAAGVVYLTMRSPVYSSIKPTYLLNCLPAWAALIGLGVESLERRRVVQAIVIGGFGALFVLVTIHVLQIVAARGFWIGS